MTVELFTFAQELLHSVDNNAQLAALVIFAAWAQQARQEILVGLWYLVKIAFIHTNILTI